MWRRKKISKCYSVKFLFFCFVLSYCQVLSHPFCKSSSGQSWNFNSQSAFFLNKEVGEQSCGRCCTQMLLDAFKIPTRRQRRKRGSEVDFINTKLISISVASSPGRLTFAWPFYLCCSWLFLFCLFLGCSSESHEAYVYLGKKYIHAFFLSQLFTLLNNRLYSGSSFLVCGQHFQLKERKKKRQWCFAWV